MGDAVESMTRAEKELCVFLSLVFTCWGMTDSIQALFYSNEAASKGATPPSAALAPLAFFHFSHPLQCFSAPPTACALLKELLKEQPGPQPSP